MKERPANIMRAMKSGDREYLVNAGIKGIEAQSRKRDIEEAKALLAAEIAELEEWRRKVSTNEHLIDPDGNDLNYIKDED